MNQVRAAFAIEHDVINTYIIDRLTVFGIIRGESLGSRREFDSTMP
ncbi:MAG: hypothetical protein P4L69_04225 [Desulfosporosinus sp.]|nr:hypothetical protein [Desulfosporosinus sp.]